ncbi:3-oxoacyl-ACP reductase FabG [Arthrobacter sp. 08Y14]|uniref:3-oxoacyl-ACP reductase FabG n=1 Tax=Arthrobacter sp. 08Y14 TaxID=2058885 RepID=UPI000CE2B694|nr:3-oxoacyl-ACP reductase FabG [Arthrobacter sp. 08Y14]
MNGAGALLLGKTAVITGAGQGIGLATARRFLAHGANVVIADIDEDKANQAIAELVKADAPVIAVACNVASGADQDKVAALALSRFGGLDILVNNAGVTRDGYINRLSEDDYDAVLDISLKGAWLGIRAVSPLFRKQGSGSIINMSSLSGKIGNPGQTNYSAAKAGLIGLTKAAAKELGPAGVRVNAIQPGLVRTDMTLAMKPEIFAAKEAEVPLARAGEPEEVADAAVFLASPMASYINGAVLEVTGGRGI